VGIYPAGLSPFGLADMSGNVWEWCAESRDKYPDSEVTDPVGSTREGSRVVRRGCWGNNTITCRDAFRNGSPPTKRNDNIGFRVVW
jgi:formylglycine-generating enzyme required for sulfatase activity